MFFAIRSTAGTMPVTSERDMAEDKGVNVVVPVESVEGFTGVVGELKVIECRNPQRIRQSRDFRRYRSL
jgi:hypothetical protein